VLAALVTGACGPRASIPPRPVSVPAEADSLHAALARSLAPTLYVQRDEYFAIERVAAVVHPELPLIAYHLLWRDDVNGAWIPFTKATDQEVVWIGYDTVTLAATDIWTYWHGKTLYLDWRGRGHPEINVQWGKHGSIPRGLAESELPRFRTMNVFYAFTMLSHPDIWLGNLTRSGPWGFFYGYDRYRDFSRRIPLRDTIDVVLHTDDPKDALKLVFGSVYSEKRPWPRAALRPLGTQ
jgi:hypothetical protein